MPELTEPEPVPKVPVTNPKLALFAVQQVPFGLANCGVLVVFTVSSRSCMPMRSVNWVVLERAKFMLKNPGPIMELRPTLPTCWAAPAT